MLGTAPEIDTLIVPIGGGGLISGIGVAAKALKPGIRLIGVQAALYPSMYNAIKGTSLPMRGDTLAEGIAVKAPGRITQAIVRELVDDIVLVTEPEIEHAVSLLINIEKTVVEGAGAAGLAAALKTARALWRAARVGLVLCGGNIDTRLLASVLTRELAREGRLTPAHHRSGRSAGHAGQGRQPAGRGRRQHRRGLPPAHLLRPAGQGARCSSVVIETRDREHLEETVASSGRGLRGRGAQQPRRSAPTGHEDHRPHWRHELGEHPPLLRGDQRRGAHAARRAALGQVHRAFARLCADRRDAGCRTVGGGRAGRWRTPAATSSAPAPKCLACAPTPCTRWPASYHRGNVDRRSCTLPMRPRPERFAEGAAAAPLT